LPDHLDASAFNKLVCSEPEGAALRRELVGRELLSSSLLVVEGRRAARRDGELAARRARAGLTAVTLLPLDHRILEAAADSVRSRPRWRWVSALSGPDVDTCCVRCRYTALSEWPGSVSGMASNLGPRLRLIDGKHVDVAERAKPATRTLSGKKSGEDAPIRHDARTGGEHD
jgi:hypothetical protein